MVVPGVWSLEVASGIAHKNMAQPAPFTGWIRLSSQAVSRLRKSGNSAAIMPPSGNQAVIWYTVVMP